MIDRSASEDLDGAELNFVVRRRRSTRVQPHDLRRAMEEPVR
jgi:hypothetical protein